MRIISYVFILIVTGIGVFFAFNGVLATDEIIPQEDVSEEFQHKLSSISIPFVQNTGQINKDVKYYADTFAGRVFVTNDDITYAILHNDTSYVIKEQIVGKNAFSPIGMESSPTNISSFIGNDPDKWKSQIPTFDSISLGETWTGIDISLYAYGNNIEKLFTIQPYQDVTQIQMTFDGISKIKTDVDGNLILYSTLSDQTSIMSMTAPVAYQEINGEKIDVAVNYKIIDDVVYGFTVGTYNIAYPLIIDPVIQATYLGGTGDDFAYRILLDSTGNVFVMVDTDSTDFPSVAGANATAGGNFDLVVSKLNNDLTSLTQATYIGGSGDDEFAYMAIDASDNIFFVARTTSNDFSGTSGGAQDTYGGGRDAVVVKLTNDLTTLTQSTYLGGSGLEIASGISIDGSGNVFVSGRTASANFPGTTLALGGLTDGAQNATAGSNDIFVSKLSNDLSDITQSTYLGTSSGEFDGAMALDGSGNVFVTGRTDGANFPGTTVALGGVTNGAQETNAGGVDVFVSKLNSDLTDIIQSTYLGGSACDITRGIGIDSFDNVFVTGATSSFDYPFAAGGAQSIKNSTGTQTNCDVAPNAAYDVFVSKLNNALTSITQSTYLGGTDVDDMTSGFIIAFDGSDNVYVGGNTASTNFPGTSGGIHESYLGGSNDIFISKINNGLTTLVQSTYLGGTGVDDEIGGIAISGTNVYVSFDTLSDDNSGTSEGAQETNGGGTDVFIVKLSSFLAVVAIDGRDGGSCNDCTPPTFGKDKNGKPIVSNGFMFNGNATDVTDYHTEFPLITVITNQTNTVTVKMYENNGVNNIRLAQFGMGMPEIGDSLSHAQTLLEIWLVGSEIEEIVKIDKNNLVDILNVTTSIVDCGYVGTENCLQVTLDYIYRDQPKYNIMAINAMDNNRNAQTNYMNDGILVVGDSLNEPLIQQTSTSEAGKLYPQKVGLVNLTLLDYKTDVWQDEYGYLWSTNNYGPYLVDDIPIPKKTPDKYSKWSGYNDRFHSEFKNYVEFQSIKAEMMASNAYYKYDEIHDNFVIKKVIEPDFTNGCYSGTKLIRDSCVFDDVIAHEIKRAELITVDYSNWKN